MHLYMKFESNHVAYDFIIVSTSAKGQAVTILAATLVRIHQTHLEFNLG